MSHTKRSIAMHGMLIFILILSFPSICQDGLLLSISSARRKFCSGEPIPLTMRITNQSSKSMVLCWNYDEASLNDPEMAARLYEYLTSSSGKNWSDRFCIESLLGPATYPNVYRSILPVINGEKRKPGWDMDRTGIPSFVELLPGMFIEQQLLLFPDGYAENQFSIHLRPGRNTIQLEYIVAAEDLTVMKHLLSIEHELFTCPRTRTENLFGWMVKSNVVTIDVEETKWNHPPCDKHQWKGMEVDVD